MSSVNKKGEDDEEEDDANRGNGAVGERGKRVVVVELDMPPYSATNGGAVVSVEVIC